MNTNKQTRYLGEMVVLTRDCELGKQGERATVTSLVDQRYMTLNFGDRQEHTGVDYQYLENASGAAVMVTMTRDQLNHLLKLARAEGVAHNAARTTSAPGVWERVAKAEQARMDAVQAVLTGGSK